MQLIGRAPGGQEGDIRGVPLRPFPDGRGEAVPMNYAGHVKVKRERFGAIVFDTLREKVFVTNGAGRDILDLLEEGRGVEEIVSELITRYACETSRIEEDVRGFIQDLVDKKVLIV